MKFEQIFIFNAYTCSLFQSKQEQTMAVVQVEKYEDIEQVENEICRLLRCDVRRKPACICTEEFWKFRCHILQLLLHQQQVPLEVAESRKCVLSQNLKAFAGMHDEGAVVVVLEWDRDSVIYGNMEEDAAHAQYSAKRKRCRYDNDHDGEKEEEAAGSSVL